MLNLMHNNIFIQPIINIGALGAVSDGKSTCIEKLTGTRTQRHSKEKSRNITIKQGYGNMKIWENTSDGVYYTTDSNPTKYMTPLGDETKLVNHVSFVDCPGHQELIHTMLSSLSLMDGAIVVVAVDQPIANKPQLIQHLIAAKLSKIDKLIICMNKIDLVEKNILMKRKDELDHLLNRLEIQPFAIIPTSFNKRLGINYLVKAIMELFHPSKYSARTTESPIFQVSRTFDINKPGINWEQLSGGVIGGTLFKGQLKLGDEIEIRPGQINKLNDKLVCEPIKTQIMSIKTDSSDLQSIVPGGLIGIRTELDPFYCKNDALIGNIAGKSGTLPSVFTKLNLIINPISEKINPVQWKPQIGENLMIQILTKIIEAKIKSVNNLECTFETVKPVCIPDHQNLIICQNNNKILNIVATALFEYSYNLDRILE